MNLETELIQRALIVAGYEFEDPTEENLIGCFRDYVDCGAWSDLTLEEIEGISVKDMCIGLIKLKS